VTSPSHWFSERTQPLAQTSRWDSHRRAEARSHAWENSIRSSACFRELLFDARVLTIERGMSTISKYGARKALNLFVGGACEYLSQSCGGRMCLRRRFEFIEALVPSASRSLFLPGLNYCVFEGSRDPLGSAKPRSAAEFCRSMRAWLLPSGGRIFKCLSRI
jgi:hypothetical protein